MGGGGGGRREGKKLATSVAKLCNASTFALEDTISRDTIDDILRKDIMEVTQLGVQMGSWLMQASANTMDCIVNSIYPDEGPHVLQTFQQMPRQVFQSQVTFLWTSDRDEEMTHQNWVANHVVPLLPIVIIDAPVAVEEADENVMEMEFRSWDVGIGDFSCANGGV